VAFFDNANELSTASVHLNREIQLAQLAFGDLFSAIFYSPWRLKSLGRLARQSFIGRSRFGGLRLRGKMRVGIPANKQAPHSKHSVAVKDYAKMESALGSGGPVSSIAWWHQRSNLLGPVLFAEAVRKHSGASTLPRDIKRHSPATYSKSSRSFFTLLFSPESLFELDTTH
jgi:hypothetical protein